MDYNELQRDALSRGEGRRDCAVKAVAVAAGVDYETAHDALAEQGRQHNKTTPRDITWAALRSLGFHLEEVTQLARRRGCKTVVSSEQRLTGGVFLVHVKGHVLCIRQGRAVDWTSGRRQRTQRIFRITPA